MNALIAFWRTPKRFANWRMISCIFIEPMRSTFSISHSLLSYSICIDSIMQQSIAILMPPWFRLYHRLPMWRCSLKHFARWWATVRCGVSGSSSLPLERCSTTISNIILTQLSIYCEKSDRDSDSLFVSDHRSFSLIRKKSHTICAAKKISIFDWWLLQFSPVCNIFLAPWLPYHSSTLMRITPWW